MNISGPAVLLPARAVVPFSMVLHELTTNAAKYGALSTPGGNIEITWQVTGGTEQSVELVWREHGGPKVKAAAADGLRHKIDRSRHPPRSRWQHQGRLRSGWRALDDAFPLGSLAGERDGNGRLRYRIAGSAKTFSQIRRSSRFVERLGDARHRAERRRKKRLVVIARRDNKP